MSNYVMRGPNLEANDATNNQGFQVYMESVNNLLYDYKSSGSRYTSGIETNPSAASRIDFRFHMLSNMFIPRPGRRVRDIEISTRHGVTDRLKVHVANNIGPKRPRDSDDAWAGVETNEGTPIRQASSAIRNQMSDARLFQTPIPVTEHTAQQALALVLENAGATKVRDAVDVRVLDDIRQRRFRDELSSQQEVGGWPTLASGTAPRDSDRDGMPDDWETAHGLNESDARDRNAIGAGGRTNLEIYLDALVPAFVVP